MNNAVVVTMFNQTPEQLALSKDAVASVLMQDVPVDLYLIDNGSIDDGYITSESTKEWTANIAGWAVEHEIPVGGSNISVETYPTNISPVKIANEWLGRLFVSYDTVLGCPNDVLLPSNCITELLKWPQGIVAPGMHGDRPPRVMATEEIHRVHGDVHMSVAMVRKSAYDALMGKDGFFLDGNFWLYCSDCDLKLRLALAGIPTAQTDLLCWHFGGASHRLALPSYTQLMNDRTHDDRAYFAEKWKFNIGSPEYGEIIAKLK